MIRSLVPALLLGVAMAGASGYAEAKSIKEAVPPSALADFCAEHGVGSETEATLNLTDGTSLTGSIHCEAEDLVAGGDDPVTPGVDDHKGHRAGEHAGERHGDDDAIDTEDDDRDDDEDEAEDHSGHHEESDDHSSDDHESDADSDDDSEGDDDGDDDGDDEGED